MLTKIIDAQYGNYTHAQFFLELWTCSEDYYKKKDKKKELEMGDQKEIASVSLFADNITNTQKYDNIFQGDYDGGGHLRNWGLGMLKNQIQCLMSYLNKGGFLMRYEDSANKTELSKLKYEVLYVPDYTLIRLDPYRSSETEKYEEKKIFGSYKEPYKIISIADLNKRILTEKTAFYYLVYVRQFKDIYVSVVNSLTGEIVYSTYKYGSYNISSKDLKKLNKKIQKS